MRAATGIILLLFAALLQVTLMMRITLLQGPADLVLLVLLAWMLQPGNRTSWLWGLPAGLMIGYSSALPDYVPLLGYAAAAGICQLLQTRIWQVPAITLLSATLLGTLAVQLSTMFYLWLTSQPIDLLPTINLITIPSIVLNLILLLPVNALIGEVSRLLSPDLEPA